MPVVHYPPVIGGFEVFLENIAERVGRDTDFFVLTGKVAGAPRRERKDRLRIFRTASFWELGDTSTGSYLYIFSSLILLFFQSLRVIKRENISVLHANGFFNGFVCLLLKKVTGVPYVMTIQSADFTIYHPGALYKLISGAQGFVERAIYRNASVCHGVSHDLCKHFRNQGVEECVMIPNGVEMDLFRPLSGEERKAVRREYGIPEEKKVVVNVSRLEYKNGVGDVIDAVRELSREVVLVVVGDGSLRDDLEVKAENIGVADRVHFLGGMDREDVGRVVGALDVFVRTPYSEGFGIVFLEAMAAEVPVVATEVGGITDFVVEGQTGLFAKVGNSEDIARCISDLLEKQDLRESIISNAKDLVEEKYNWDHIASRVRDLYLQVHEG